MRDGIKIRRAGGCGAAEADVASLRTRDGISLGDIVSRAAAAYPDAAPLLFWDEKLERAVANAGAGDALAEFVVRELASVFDAGATDSENLVAAVKAMQRAADELADVAQALSDLVVERLAA